MRERLRDGEPALPRRKVLAEHRLRDVVARLRRSRDCGLDDVQPLAVMLDDLACAPGRVLDRLTVAG